VKFRLALLPALLAMLPASGLTALAQRLPLASGSVRPTKAVRSLKELREHGMMRQRWDMSCGSAALSTVLTYDYQDPTPETAVVIWILRRTDPVRVRSRGGFSLLDLKRFAQFRGYEAEGYAKLSLAELVKFPSAIVPVRINSFDHFVVFRGLVGDRVVLADPAFGNLTLSKERFLRIWKNGIGFIVHPQEEKISPSAASRRQTLPLPDVSTVYRSLYGSGVLGQIRRSR
jgi:predicted double-glycine peptidase